GFYENKEVNGVIWGYDKGSDVGVGDMLMWRQKIGVMVLLHLGCLCALDGTLIRVTPPSDQKSGYQTRKSNIATNVLGVCCPNMQFIYVLPGWEGSARDGHVLRDAISREDGLKIPQGTQVRIILACCLLHNLIRKYMSVDPLEVEQAEEDEIEDGDPSGDDDYLAHINQTNEWSNFRNDLAHQMFTSWREG
nr:protein ALP1-like [Tanacetum cinerariifolium]